MEYQKIINLLDSTPNQPTKFRTKNWVEINDNSCGTYNTNSQVKLKISMLKSSLCDYGDSYILVSGTITVVGLLEEEQTMQQEPQTEIINNQYLKILHRLPTA